jgi:hypothetical protein
MGVLFAGAIGVEAWRVFDKLSNSLWWLTIALLLAGAVCALIGLRPTPPTLIRSEEKVGWPSSAWRRVRDGEGPGRFRAGASLLLAGALCAAVFSFGFDAIELTLTDGW